MNRKVCLMGKKLDKDQAIQTLSDIIEGFELDMLDQNGEEFKLVREGLVPAIMRGRIEADIENFRIAYKLKTPICFKEGDAEPIEVLTFSIAQSRLKNVKQMEKAAGNGNVKPIIFTFAKDETPELKTEQMLDSISHSDANVAGAVGTLFLAF